MIGRTLSHYRIVEKIGAGGMGEVYRARDEHLGRDVAIKVLPAGTLADEHARSRFRKEAEALSKLNHPHICTVHDFDTQDGTDFLVMELVEGTALSDQLAAGPLAEKEVARLGSQVAEALEEAHEQGVVHRDLKPGNIKVTPKGQVKVLDFGLAKLLRPVSATATTESFTETQGVAGTLPYMAPEQLRGEAVDARTDIHALGAVVYEMATGQRAFPDRQPAQLTAAILQLPPSSPRALNRRVSVELERVVLKCLEKEPENRYQSAKEIGVDLRRLGTPGSAAAVLSARRPATRRRMVWAAGVAPVALLAVLVGLNVGGLRDRLLGRPAPGQITSIAVLPLENLMGDSEQDYFVAGMHEALITELSKIGALKVISRTSAMRYKDTDKSVPEIARELGVDAVVEGSVLRAGETVRVTAQLIDGRTDRHLWADKFDRDLGDILALHSEVAQAIAQEIKIAVTPEEEARLARARPVNPAAYEDYLRGRYQFNKLNREGMEAATGYFQESIEKDPSYAPAYAMMSFSYTNLGYYSPTPPAVSHSRALAAAERAVALDNSLAEAHASLAMVKTSFDWDWVAADRASQEGLRLNPNSTMALYSRAVFLSWVGRHEEAIAIAKRAVELDPVALPVNNMLGMHYFMARRYDEAIGQLNKVVALEPNYRDAHIWLTYSYAKKGMYEEAATESRKIGAPLRLLWLDAWILALAGRSAEARKVVEQIPAEWRAIPNFAYYDAITLGELGEKDRAFAALEQAYQGRTALMSALKVDPRIDSLRVDPRFQSLLRRMNFPE